MNNPTDKIEFGTLIIIFSRAKNLPNRRKFDKQNPYCIARIGSLAHRCPADVRGGQTPVWDAETRFKLYENRSHTGPKINTSVSLSVLDETDTRPELIGTVEIDLTRAYKSPPSVGYDNWHHLGYQGKYAGEVFLEITFYPARPPLPNRPLGYNPQPQQQFQLSQKPQQQQFVQSGIRKKQYPSENHHALDISVSGNSNLNSSLGVSAYNISHGTSNIKKKSYSGNLSSSKNNSINSWSGSNSYNNCASYLSNQSVLSTTSSMSSRPLPRQPYQRVVKTEPEPEPEPAMFVAPVRPKGSMFQSGTSPEASFHQSSYIYQKTGGSTSEKNQYYNGGKIIGLPAGIRYAPMLETTPVKKKKAAHQAQQPQKPFLKFPEVPYKTNGDSFSEQQQQQSLHKVAARDQTHLRSPVLMHSPRMSRSVRSTNSDLDHETLSFFSSPLPDAGREWSSLSTSTGSSGNTSSAGTEVVASGDKAKKALKKRITVKRKPVSDPSMSAATASSQIMFSPEDYGTEPPLTPVSPLVLPEEADRLDETTYAPQPVFLKNSTRAPLPTTAAELVDPGLSRYAGEGQWNVTHEISNENPTKTLVGDRPYSAYTCSTAPLVMTKTTTPVVATTTATTAAAAAAGGGGGFNRRSSTVRRKPRVPPKVPIGMSPEEFIAMEYAVYDKTEEDDRLRYINPV